MGILPTRSRLSSFAVVAAAVFAVIQLIPVDTANPAVLADIAAPAEVDEILRRSCYDCHSNETRWPWYSRVAPVSWLVGHDVEEGREHLNFSEWGLQSAEEQSDEIEEIWEMVDDGEMPLWFYLPLHPDARIREADKAVLRRWVVAHNGTSILERGARDHEHDHSEHGSD